MIAARLWGRLWAWCAKVNNMNQEKKLREKLAPMLVEHETIEWIGRPARLPRLYVRVFRVIGAIAAVILTLALVFEVLLPLHRGEIIMMEGEPLTLKRALPPTLITVISVGGFAYLWMRQSKSVRYIVTNMRALIYMPVWGASFSFNFKKKKLERNYTDPEYSPISGGYFTADTTVSQTGPDTYGYLNISNLRSDMDDAKAISVVKKVLPFLDGVIYDPANLIFTEIQHAEMARLHIQSIIDKHRPKDPQTP